MGRLVFRWFKFLSLHLNHLIASCAANYDRPFGTLPFGPLWSNLDTRDLEVILGPILVIFEICVTVCFGIPHTSG